jgi:hypothetical protein
MSRCRLTKPQTLALQMLVIASRETSRTTHHEYVSGRTMQALVARGLAEPIAGFVNGKYRITNAGSLALDVEMQRRMEKK